MRKFYISKKTQADAIPSQPGPEWLKKKVLEFKPDVYTSTEALTPHEDVTTYNNFYEFGTGKGDPVRNAHTLKTDPWSVVIEGEVAKPGRYHLKIFSSLMPWRSASIIPMC